MPTPKKPPASTDDLLHQLQDLLARVRRGEITAIHAITSKGERIGPARKKAPGPKRGG